MLEAVRSRDALVRNGARPIGIVRTAEAESELKNEDVEFLW